VKENGPSNAGLLYGNSEHEVMATLAALRGEMFSFHGNAFYPQPNTWAAFMTCLVDLYCMLMIVTYPFKMFVPLRITRFHGFQPFTVLSVFLMTLCLWGADSLTYVFSSPFADRIDTFNIDALAAGTEQTLFASMRASFDSAKRNQKPKELPRFISLST